VIVWLKGEQAKLEKNNSELLKLRGEVALLRNQAKAFNQGHGDGQKQFSNKSRISPEANASAEAPGQIHVKARFLSLPKGK